jgi:3-deoxy-D-manno-octulosonic acid kinase
VTAATVAHFEHVRDGRLEIVVRADLRALLLPLLHAAADDYAGVSVTRVPGGRGATVAVRVAGEHFAIRAGRRGGLPGKLISSLYFGTVPRPFIEIDITAGLHDRGVPVVEPCAAAVQWVVPGCYRSWLVTRWVDDARTLWAWAAVEREKSRREHVFVAVGRALRLLHDAGATHPDLNLNNVLVRERDGRPDVLLLDFDRAQIPLASVEGAADFRRLRRSARKLDPEGVVVSAADLDLIERASHAHGPARQEP